MIKSLNWDTKQRTEEGKKRREGINRFIVISEIRSRMIECNLYYNIPATACKKK
jgi:hypothetical protein